VFEAGALAQDRGVVARRGRAHRDPQAASQRVSVFATAPCNHTAILRKCPGLVVAAIKDVAERA